tara:strand:- start:1417 stop:1596 length:180 start_codon:yes stop_codon:yes gene_type:complete
MSTPKNQITNKGVPNQSGLEVYMTVTIDSVEYLIPIVMTDNFGNAHKILRRRENQKISD